MNRGMRSLRWHAWRSSVSGLPGVSVFYQFKTMMSSSKGSSCGPKAGFGGSSRSVTMRKPKVGRWPWLDMTLLRKTDEISRKQKWPSSREPYQAQSPCALEHGSLGLGWRLAAFALWSLLPDACNSFHSSCTCTTWQADSAVEAFGDGLEAFHCALQILRRSGILVGEVTSSSVSWRCVECVCIQKLLCQFNNQSRVV